MATSAPGKGPLPFLDTIIKEDSLHHSSKSQHVPMDRRNPKSQDAITPSHHPCLHEPSYPPAGWCALAACLAAPAVKRVLVFRDRGPRSTVSRSRACNVPDRPPLAASCGERPAQWWLFKCAVRLFYSDSVQKCHSDSVYTK